MSTRTGLVYLQVTTDRRPGRLRVVRATQNMPGVIDPGAAVVKFRLTMPDAAFAAIDGGELAVPESATYAAVEPEPIGGDHAER